MRLTTPGQVGEGVLEDSILSMRKLGLLKKDNRNTVRTVGVKDAHFVDQADTS